MSILRVGTDCSGIEAPIQALLQLKIPFEHVFSSDIDKYCIQSIKANYKPKIIFGDITKRDINDVPDIDLYVCGFPCQPFSTAGKRKGFKDKRGNVFWSCLEVIELKQPKYFILENVRGLLSHNKGDTWKVIWEALSGLEKYGYNVQWKVLNTRDYGIPQNRERIFIVGTKEAFVWPKKIKINDLKKYVDWDDNSISIYSNIYKKRLKLITNNTIFVNSGFNYNNYPHGEIYSPCLVSSCASHYWCRIKHRLANVREWLMLQGFPIKFIVHANTLQMKKQIGNSMSVNVVKEIIKNIFQT
jgi:DNA (cytosine-5)-methyltransferase 1